MNLTEKALRMAEAIGGKNGLNCIAELSPTALEESKAAETGDAAGRPLRGVPVLVKDNIDVKGLHTTAGSLALEDNIALADAPVIANLRRRGAVILGKTNMTEFANYVTQGMPGGYSSRGGQVIHAVNPALSPSGSSSGSAVAVAAGIVPMAVGTDTSFSILACAQANGICGLKPPIGALPSEGIVPIAKTLDSAGPMAQTFSDALALYSAMRDKAFPTVKPAGRLRLAVNRANGGRLSDGERLFLGRTMERLKKAGATADEIDQPPAPCLVTIMQWEFRPMLEAYLKRSAASRKTLAEIVACYEAHPDTMMKYGITRLRAALDETPGGLEGAPYREALEERRALIGRVANEIAPYDAVIMTGPTNVMHVCGLPSVTVAGREKDDMGVRRALIMYGADECRLYAAALAIEAAIS